MNSGRIEEDDPRLFHPTRRVTDWVYPTLESIAAMAAEADAELD